MNQFLILLFTLLLPFQLFAQESIFQKWKTIDDETGNARSIVDIYEKDGKAYGKVIKILPVKGRPDNPLCTGCGENNKDRPVLGMHIIWDMEKDDDEWENGEIMDPRNGKVYDCKMWIEGGKLYVRGYLGIFFRTQVWEPYEG